MGNSNDLMFPHLNIRAFVIDSSFEFRHSNFAQIYGPRGASPLLDHCPLGPSGICCSSIITLL